MAAPMKVLVGRRSLELLLKSCSRRVPAEFPWCHQAWTACQRCLPAALQCQQYLHTTSALCDKTEKPGSSSSGSESSSDSNSDSDSDTERAPVKRLNLASPSGSSRQSTKKQKEVQLNTSETELEDDLVAAAKSVAASLGGSTEQTESDLLAQLRAHASNQSQKTAKNDFSSLFSQMEIEERVGYKKKPQREPASQPPSRTRKRTESSKQYDRSTSTIPPMKLFEGDDLGIFTPSDQIPENREPTLFDKLEKEELKRQGNLPNKNAFEEMIKWTEQGKLWTFPINNEAGMDEEAKVGFHEHVFLEPLLEPFPKKGPIRHFMELVINGLSKNPYMSVQEKHEHVAWFDNYFKEKQSILDETIQM